MSTSPWFPFYVGDYLRDTARLTTEAHGAYLLLMLDYWTNGAPPDDDETLASIARLLLEHWLELRPKLVPFFEIADGRWNHKRIEKELRKAGEKYKKRSVAGKKGGIASSNARAMLKQNSSNAGSKTQANVNQPQPQPHIKERKKEEDVACAPNKLDSNSTEPSESPQKKNNGAYAFQDGIIRLNRRDFDQWQEAYSYLDLKAELLSLSQWAGDQGKNWFHAIKAVLAKRNRIAKAEQDRAASQSKPETDPVKRNPWDSIL